MTDRKAAVQQVAEALHALSCLNPLRCHGPLSHETRAADALWPLICQAREQHQRDLLNLRAQLEAEHEEMQERAYEDGKAEGRREAAEAIEALPRSVYVTTNEKCHGWYCGEEDADACPGHPDGYGRYTTREEYAAAARGAQQSDEKERTDGQ